jgi:DegV family protein with EDD domain
VTDSAADLPSSIAQARGIRVVPLTITFGSQAFVDGTELPADRFWQKMRTERDLPTTAAPSGGDFEQAYRELLAEGADGIVSVHLSSKLSFTYQSALLGAKETGDSKVAVVDSLGVSAATALMALRAADLADQGTAVDQIVSDIEGLRSRMHLFATVDTLEFLRRGGRIGGAQALLGTMLQVKPVITLSEGTVEPSGRVRTRSKALQHLAGLVQSHAGEIEKLIVMDGEAADLDVFVGLLREFMEVPDTDVWTFGPVVGTHAGPGIIGVVYVTRG